MKNATEEVDLEEVRHCWPDIASMLKGWKKRDPERSYRIHRNCEGVFVTLRGKITVEARSWSMSVAILEALARWACMCPEQTGDDLITNCKIAPVPSEPILSLSQDEIKHVKEIHANWINQKRSQQPSRHSSYPRAPRK